MAGYAKLWSGITESSLWACSKEARLVFVTLLARADSTGFVEAALSGLARISNLTIEETRKGLDELMAPDLESKSPTADGRRVAVVPRGYCVVNYEEHRARRDDNERREWMRNYMKGYRERGGAVNRVNIGKPPLAQAEAEAEAEKQHTPLAGRANVGGFGVAIPETPPNEFDAAQAGILEAAVGKLPPIQRPKTKPSTWPHHLKLLRTKDGVKEEDISRVMKWYAAHIGGEFIPQAYSGEAFRKKWSQLYVACGKDRTAVVEITPEAKTIGKRLLMANWPKGSDKGVVDAVQACLDAYAAWRRRCKAFRVKLESEDLTADPKRARLLAFAKHLKSELPPPDSFVENWMEWVHDQIKGWDGWRGNLSPYVFKPSADRFKAMGRGWAAGYGGAGLWDHYMETINKEAE